MQNVTIPEGVLTCLSRGNRNSTKPAIVLLHGIQGTASIWLPVMDMLSDDRWVIAPNLRGRAGSYSPDLASDYELTDFAGDLQAVLDHLPAPVVLVGWSMGSLVALEYLRRYGTQRISQLALVSSTPCIATTGGQDAMWFQGDTTEALALNAAERAKRLGLVETASDIAVAGSWLSVKAADYREILPEIGLPTLILHGEDDPDCPVAHAKVMADALPGAHLRLWPGCGHVPMAHDPVAFVKELDAFLASA